MRKGDDDMEKTSSLKFIALNGLPDLSRSTIVNDSRFFHSVNFTEKLASIFNKLQISPKWIANYGLFTLIIIMRSKTSLTCC